MNQNKEKKLVFMLLIASVMIFSNSLVNIKISNSDHLNSTNELELKDSGFWNLTGITIFINDTDPAYDWSKTASENDWCSGNGTLINPYVIKDVVIDGLGSGSCIEIRNSNAYFEIVNCSLYNSTFEFTNAAIRLINVTNCKLLGNNLTNNLAFGIYLSDVFNSSILGNEIINSTYGIGATSSHNCNISANTIQCIKNESAVGIYFSNSQNITLNSNNMTNGGFLILDFYLDSNPKNVYFHNIDNSNKVNEKILYFYINQTNLSLSYFNNSGQIILVNCNESSISNVDLSHSSMGLTIVDCNMITMKNITSNFNLWGIVLYNTNNSLFSGYNVSNNGFAGLQISECNNNTIANISICSNGNGIFLYNNNVNNTFYGNHFENNTKNVYCYSSSADNLWNSSKIGNYWDDYTGTDANDDNMGDTPHIDGLITDYLPVWWDAPAISIVSPSNLSVYGRMDDQNFSIIIDEGFGNYTWHEFLETGNSSVFIELNGTLDEEYNSTFIENQWDLMNNGTTTIRFYANDSRGYIGFKDLFIHVDILAPVINVISPIGKVSGTTAPNFTINFIDGSLHKTWYTLNNNNTKFFFISNGVLNQNAWNLLPDEIVNIKFHANDTFGHEHSETVRNYKDTEKPEIIDNQDDIKQYHAGKVYDVDFKDSNLLFNISYIQYTIWNSTGRSGERYLVWTNITTNIGANSYTDDWAIDFSKCKNGLNYISVSVFDEAGNNQTLNDVFIVTKADPPYTNPLRDFLLMIMIGIPALIASSLSIYYGTKYYIKSRIDATKIMERKKKMMEKKKQKYLSLADEYLAMSSSNQTEQSGETSAVYIDAETQLTATKSSTEDQAGARPPIETKIISIICPICKKNKKVIIPKAIVNEAKQLTAVSIAKDIVCEHHFQAFVDKNFVVRGYQKIDYHL